MLVGKVKIIDVFFIKLMVKVFVGSIIDVKIVNDVKIGLIRVLL